MFSYREQRLPFAYPDITSASPLLCFYNIKNQPLPLVFFYFFVFLPDDYDNTNTIRKRIFHPYDNASNPSFTLTLYIFPLPFILLFLFYLYYKNSINATAGKIQKHITFFNNTKLSTNKSFCI